MRRESLADRVAHRWSSSTRRCLFDKVSLAFDDR
jgi:hypothetical protein